MMKEENPTYAAAWDDLRKRQLLFFVAWLGGFALVALLSSVKSVPFWIAPTLWLAAFLYTGSRWSLFLCPRCQKPFFKPKSWLIDQTLQACPHCGLPKYADTDAGAGPNRKEKAMKQKTPFKQVLVTMVLFTASVTCVLATVYNAMLYRALFNTDYFASRIANGIGLFLIPILLIPPFVFWCGKGFGMVSPRTAARMTLCPGIIWIAALVMLSLMEYVRPSLHYKHLNSYHAYRVSP